VRLDRLARSTRDLLNLLDRLVKSLRETSVDTTSPQGRLVVNILASISEFERELIHARMTEGRKRAVANGVKFGPKFKLNSFQRQEALARLAAGESQSVIAKTYGVDPRYDLALAREGGSPQPAQRAATPVSAGRSARTHHRSVRRERRVGRGSVRNGTITITQQKTKTALVVPVTAVPAEAINATANEAMVFLLNEHGGKAFTAKGFGKWFTAQCQRVGLTGLSPHGLRKVACRRLAEAGCSANEIASISGHATLREVERYTRAADQARMARNALAKTEVR
jgi:hypothetical protein